MPVACKNPTPLTQREAGFTLLEVLVVALIIGIVLSIAVINFPDNLEKKLGTEARRLNTLIGLAQQEAIIRGRELVVELHEDRYRFLILDHKQWIPMSGTSFRPRTLPDQMTLEAFMEGTPLIKNKDNKEDEETDKETWSARIFVLSSGELSNFSLKLSHPNVEHVFTITGTIDGRHQLGLPST